MKETPKLYVLLGYADQVAICQRLVDQCIEEHAKMLALISQFLNNPRNLTIQQVYDALVEFYRVFAEIQAAFERHLGHIGVLEERLAMLQKC